jgi:hypothetical protein
MSLTQNAAPVFISSQTEAADPVAYAAHPLLARLTSALRAPLLPMIGFAELCAGEATPAQRQAWAAEILAASRQHLAMLDCTLALAAGRPPTTSDPAMLATAAAAVGALRSLLRPEAPAQDYHH